MKTTKTVVTIHPIKPIQMAAAPLCAVSRWTEQQRKGNMKQQKTEDRFKDCSPLVVATIKVAMEYVMVCQQLGAVPQQGFCVQDGKMEMAVPPDGLSHGELQANIDLIIEQGADVLIFVTEVLGRSQPLDSMRATVKAALENDNPILGRRAMKDDGESENLVIVEVNLPKRKVALVAKVTDTEGKKLKEFRHGKPFVVTGFSVAGDTDDANAPVCIQQGDNDELVKAVGRLA